MKRTNKTKKPLLSKKTLGLVFGIPVAFTVLALGLKILIPGEPIENFKEFDETIGNNTEA